MVAEPWRSVRIVLQQRGKPSSQYSRDDSLLIHIAAALEAADSAGGYNQASSFVQVKQEVKRDIDSRLIRRGMTVEDIARAIAEAKEADVQVQNLEPLDYDAWMHGKTPLGRAARKVAPFIVLGVVLGLGGLALWGFHAIFGTASPDLPAGAYDACEGFVQDSLKSPSSASFGGYREAAVTASGSTYTVDGTVNAENSFGVTLRENWTCTVTLSSDGKTWRLDSLTGLD